MKDTYQELLATCRKAISDPMTYVAEWKSNNPGKKAVGFLPTYVPLEPIYAAGGLPVGLWGSDTPITVADAYIQQFTCSLVRSVTELAFRGEYDKLDAVLFPPICDSLKLVGSIWDFNLSAKFLVEVANLPERLDGSAACTYLEAELRRVTRRLTDATIDNGQFAKGIAQVNRLRKSLGDFCAWRSNHQVPFAEATTILRGATVLHADEYCSLVDGVISNSHSSSGPQRGIPVVVSGLSCQLPHLEMMQCFDEAGLTVVEDDLFIGLQGTPTVESSGDPYANIAQSYCRSAPMAIRHAEHVKRHERLVDQFDRSRAKGIVFMVPKFCEPEWFDLRYLQQEMRQRNVPNIVIDFEEGLGATGSLQTRISAFAETIS